MSHRLQVLVPETLDAKVRKAAQRAGLSKGEWVRRAIQAALISGSRSETDPLRKLATLEGPTADVDQMLSEIEAGRQ